MTIGSVLRTTSLCRTPSQAQSLLDTWHRPGIGQLWGGYTSGRATASEEALLARLAFRQVAPLCLDRGLYPYRPLCLLHYGRRSTIVDPRKVQPQPSPM